MASSIDHTKLFKGFSKLNKEDRFKRLQKMGALSSDDVKFLRNGGLKDTSLAEKFVENVIGYFQLPLGVATNFRIDGKDIPIPMAVEETSIIAAASKTARWVRENGIIQTQILGEHVIGQIQFAKVKDFEKIEAVLNEQHDSLVELANKDVAHGLVARGGGVSHLKLRKIKRDDGFFMAVIHVFVDTCDAMGANIVNQVCEYLKIPLQSLTGESVSMCILSNLVDSKVTRAEIRMSIDEEVGQKIVEASLFSQLDPYRAATNNKGVLNGIDPILIATGNDWRAVEAGIHAYAARKGQYESVTKWKMDGKKLVGVFEAPVVVGTVGGVTKLHPMAQMSLEMMGIKRSSELSKICAAVGLVQNLGALKALMTVGIIEGHMKLHIKNLTLGAGADEKEIPILQKKLEEILKLTKRISLSQAIEILKELRSGSKDSGVKEQRV